MTEYNEFPGEYVNQKQFNGMVEDAIKEIKMFPFEIDEYKNVKWKLEYKKMDNVS